MRTAGRHSSSIGSRFESRMAHPNWHLASDLPHAGGSLPAVPAQVHKWASVAGCGSARPGTKIPPAGPSLLSACSSSPHGHWPRGQWTGRQAASATSPRPSERRLFPELQLAAAGGSPLDANLGRIFCARFTRTNPQVRHRASKEVYRWVDSSNLSESSLPCWLCLCPWAHAARRRRPRRP